VKPKRAPLDESKEAADARRALSDTFERVTWPPRVGERVHYNSGHPRTSWAGEVRAIVDDRAVVFLSSMPAYAGSSSYKIETREYILVYGRGPDSGGLRYGRLPRALCERNGDY
jgi:hypothetical protein